MVDAKTCRDTPYAKTSQGAFFDYCTPARSSSKAGCSCLRKWWAAHLIICTTASSLVRGPLPWFQACLGCLRLEYLVPGAERSGRCVSISRGTRLRLLPCFNGRWFPIDVPEYVFLGTCVNPGEVFVGPRELLHTRSKDGPFDSADGDPNGAYCAINPST